MGRDNIRMGRTGTAGLLAASAALIVLACETPAPTNIQDVFDQVVEARGADGGSAAGTPVRLEGVSSSGDTVFIMGRRSVYSGNDPLIFIDGRLVEPDEDRESVLGELAPDAIERIEIVKGAAAGRIIGDRGERAGAIFIYLKEGYRPGDGGHPDAEEMLQRTVEESRRAAQAYSVQESAAQARALEEAERYSALIAQQQSAAEQAQREQELYQAQQLQATERAQRQLELYQARQLGEQLQPAEAEDGAQRAELERMMERLQARIEELAARTPDSEEVAAELRRVQEQLRELIRRRDQQLK